MLVLARRTNEAIQIGPNITITVLRVKGKGVKLGIEAPADVAVLRAELLVRSGEPPSRPKPPSAQPESGGGAKSPAEKRRRVPDSKGSPRETASLAAGHIAPCAGRRPLGAVRRRAVAAAC